MKKRYKPILFLIATILVLSLSESALAITCPSSTTYTSEPTCGCYTDCSGCGTCTYADGTAESYCSATNETTGECIEWKCNYTNCYCATVINGIDPDPGECDGTKYCDSTGTCVSVGSPTGGGGSCPSGISCSGSPPCSCSDDCSCSADCWNPAGTAHSYCCAYSCDENGCKCTSHCCDYGGCYCKEVPKCGQDGGCTGCQKHCDGNGCCDDTPPKIELKYTTDAAKSNWVDYESHANPEWVNYSVDIKVSYCTDDYSCKNNYEWCIMRWGNWGKYDLGNAPPGSSLSYKLCSAPVACTASWTNAVGVTETIDDHTYVMLKAEDENCNPGYSGVFEIRVDEEGGPYAQPSNWCEPPAEYHWTGESIDLTFNFSDQGDSGPDVVGFGYYLADAAGNMFYYEDPYYFDCFSNPPGPSSTDGGYCDPDVACNSNTKSVYCEKTITFNTKNPPLGGDCGDGCDYLFTCITTYDTAGNFLGAWDVADDYTAADLKPPEVWLTGVSGGGKVIVSLHCRDDESGCDPSSYMIYKTGDTTKPACESKACSLPCPGTSVGSPPVEFYSDVCVCGYAEDNVGHKTCSGTKI